MASVTQVKNGGILLFSLLEQRDPRVYLVDRVVYSDGSHHDDFASGVDPWPTEPDGQGQSLTRINPTSYGNDPANWRSAQPSPGE